MIKSFPRIFSYALLVSPFFFSGTHQRLTEPKGVVDVLIKTTAAPRLFLRAENEESS